MIDAVFVQKVRDDAAVAREKRVKIEWRLALSTEFEGGILEAAVGYIDGQRIPAFRYQSNGGLSKRYYVEGSHSALRSESVLVEALRALGVVDLVCMAVEKHHAKI